MRLEECFNLYNSLLNKKFILYLEDNIKIEVVFSKNNFKHLLGLQKLIDNSFVSKNKASVVYDLIQKNLIKNESILKSEYYSRIEERFTYFYIIPTLLQSQVIVKFDPSLVFDDYTSKLQNTDYILYKHISPNSTAHLTLAINAKNNYYPETFFIEHSNMYLSGQDFKNVLKVEVINL